MGSLGGLGASIVFKFLGGRKKKGVDGIERGASAPPATTVQVIALDDTNFKEWMTPILINHTKRITLASCSNHYIS